MDEHITEVYHPHERVLTNNPPIQVPIDTQVSQNNPNSHQQQHRSSDEYHSQPSKSRQELPMRGATWRPPPQTPSRKAPPCRMLPLRTAPSLRRRKYPSKRARRASRGHTNTSTDRNARAPKGSQISHQRSETRSTSTSSAATRSTSTARPPIPKTPTPCASPPALIRRPPTTWPQSSPAAQVSWLSGEASASPPSTLTAPTGTSAIAIRRSSQTTFAASAWT